jgi:hypothetical protein
VGKCRNYNEKSLKLDVTSRGAGGETTSVATKTTTAATVTAATTAEATTTAIATAEASTATTTTTETSTATTTATAEATAGTAITTSGSGTAKVSAEATAKKFETVHLIDSLLSSIFRVELDITVSFEVAGLAVSGQSNADNVTETFESFTKGMVIALKADVTNKDSIRFVAEGLGALSTVITRLSTTGRGIIDTNLTTHEFSFMVFLGLCLGFSIGKVDITVTNLILGKFLG